MKLLPEYFNYIKNGTKKLELRLNDKKRKNLKINDLINDFNIELLAKLYIKINTIMNNINQTADCENYTINEVDDKGVCLTLKLKFRK